MLLDQGTAAGFGAATGFVTGGPIGAAIGAAAGFLGASKPKRPPPPPPWYVEHAPALVAGVVVFISVAAVGVLIVKKR